MSGSGHVSPRGYHASGTWLDESRKLLDAASPLDRLDPGPIERVHPSIGTLDTAALARLAESLGTVFAGMHAAFEQFARHWQREVVPTLSAMCEQLRVLDARSPAGNSVRRVDAARRRQGHCRAARGRPDEYPEPPTRTR